MFFAKKTKKNKKKKAKASKKSVYTYIVGAFSLAVVSFVYFNTHNIRSFKDSLIDQLCVKTGLIVSNIYVNGRINLPKSELNKLILFKEGEPIFKTSTESVFKLLKAQNWIREVSVKKNLPNTIIIDIKERIPVAVYQEKQELYVIDIDGFKITKLNEVNSFKLPVITGGDANLKFKDLKKIIDGFEIIKNNINAATFVRKRRWDIVVSGLLVKLPESGVEQALAKLSEIMTSGNITKKNAKYIDFRISGQMTVNGLINVNKAI